MPPGPRQSARRSVPPSVFLRRRIAILGGVPIALAIVIYSIVAAASSSGSKSPTTSTTTPIRSSSTHRNPTVLAAVGSRMLTFTDGSRTTFNFTTGNTSKGRKLVVELRYPATVTVAPTGATVPNATISKRTPRPLIVFAPGYRLAPSDYDALLDSWATAGYLVAAVEFPDTTFPASDAPYAAHLPHGAPESDIFNEPSDIAYVVGALRSTAATKGQWLHGLVNTSEIALAGHSDGASVVAASIYDLPYAHAGLGIKAVAVVSGTEFSIANQSYGQPASGSVPLLVVQSDADLCDAPSGAALLYNQIGAPKFFEELATASHLGAVNGSEQASFSLVSKVTIAFFAQSLGIDSASSSQLSALGTVKGVGTLHTTNTLAPIPAPSGASSCPSH